MYYKLFSYFVKVAKRLFSNVVISNICINQMLLLFHDLSLLEIMAISSVNGTQSLVLVICAKKSLRMIVVME